MYAVNVPARPRPRVDKSGTSWTRARDVASSRLSGPASPGSAQAALGGATGPPSSTERVYPHSLLGQTMRAPSRLLYFCSR
jgi:hypothetical protein